MLDPNYCLDVPKGFDDSEAETGVHPIAAKLFLATSAAEVFGKAQEWVGEHDVRLTDVSWDHLFGEDQPYALTIYFSFELDDEDD